MSVNIGLYNYSLQRFSAGIVGNVAQLVGASLHDHEICGSTLTEVTLLCPWIRCFTTIISAWLFLTSSKLKKSESNFKRTTWKQRQLLKVDLHSIRSAFNAVN